MFRANVCPSSGAQDSDFLQHMVQYPVMWYAGVSERVELILEINKTVIVASSWSSIFTLPTLNAQLFLQLQLVLQREHNPP
jgi:hypothetical protein